MHAWLRHAQRHACMQGHAIHACKVAMHACMHACVYDGGCDHHRPDTVTCHGRQPADVDESHAESTSTVARAGAARRCVAPALQTVPAQCGVPHGKLPSSRLGAESAHLLQHRVDKDSLQGIGVCQQIGVRAAGIVIELPENDPVDHCGAHEKGKIAAGEQHGGGER